MKKVVYLLLGFLCLGLGIIGIFLPIIPTVPFILLSSYLFYHSSDRAYHWLMNHRLFGKRLRQYHRYRAIPKRTKAFGLTVLWLSLIASMLIFRKPITYYILPLIGLAGTIMIARIPSLSPEQLADWVNQSKAR